MNEVKSQEIEQLHEDIEDLRQHIHKLESAVATLIHSLVYGVIHKGQRYYPIEINRFNDECDHPKIVEIRLDSEKLIKELGGDREFIEIFLNPSKYKPNE